MRNRGKRRDLRKRYFFSLSTNPPGHVALSASPHVGYLRTGTFLRTLLPLRRLPWQSARLRERRITGTLARRGFHSATPATSARSLPFRSPGTFLIHLRDAGEECPRPTIRGTPRIAPGPPGDRSAARVHRTASHERSPPPRQRRWFAPPRVRGIRREADAGGGAGRSFRRRLHPQRSSGRRGYRSPGLHSRRGRAELFG